MVDLAPLQSVLRRVGTAWRMQDVVEEGHGKEGEEGGVGIAKASFMFGRKKAATSSARVVLQLQLVVLTI